MNRCNATKRDGTPCRAWANASGRCPTHDGKVRCPGTYDWDQARRDDRSARNILRAERGGAREGTAGP